MRFHSLLPPFDFILTFPPLDGRRAASLLATSDPTPRTSSRTTLSCPTTSNPSNPSTKSSRNCMFI